jgi:hypothetical protein
MDLSCILSTVHISKFLINLMKILHRPHSRAQTLNDDDTIHLSAARFAKPAETFEKFHKFEGGGIRYTFIYNEDTFHKCSLQLFL